MQEETNLTQRHNLALAYLDRGLFSEADSLVDLIAAEENNVPSEGTVILQLRAWAAANGRLSPAQQAVAQGLVAQNPLGATGAKAMLRNAFGEPYSRVPWMLNDTRAGYKNAAGAEQRKSELRLWPNPADQTVQLVSNAQPIAEVSVFASDGRVCLRSKAHAVPELSLDISTLSPGPYVLRVSLVNGSIVNRSFQKLP
ncbi:MAG: T9SS type A sorting domain-containing protein [Flavobacteriales bacterium]|nr:MAG: T9SS type A sorting domain-containing protein [Flavobacteriales bacterium]